MSDIPTLWQNLLDQIRPHLSGKDARGKKGSLRWLEAAVAERGGRAGTVRNILYKDLGSPEEKIRLFEVIRELYTVCGQPEPLTPPELTQESARRSLGRDKRQIFRKFIRGLETNLQPQIIVAGEESSGKTVLLEAVERSWPSYVKLDLSGDLSQTLFLLFESLQIEADYTSFVGTQKTSDIQLGQLQSSLLTTLCDALNRQTAALLLRADHFATIGALPLRGPSGNTQNLSEWLSPLLESLTIPYLAALTDPPINLEWSELSPPSRAEARRYTRERLPDTSPEKIEDLVSRAGKDFSELSRLVLLESALIQQSPGVLWQDERLRPMLSALSVLSLEGDPAFPLSLLESVLDKSFEDFTEAESSLITLQPDRRAKPSIPKLLQLAAPREKLRIHQIALEHFQGNTFRQIVHARGGRDFERLIELFSADHRHLSLAPDIWLESDNWPVQYRESLAKTIVRHRSFLGQFTHPENISALELLQSSKEKENHLWARVKQAEASIALGDYENASQKIPQTEELYGEFEAEGRLVWAALERWKGNYEAAERHVIKAQSPFMLPTMSDRVRLWEGLVAKDAGRFTEALDAFEKVQHDALLIGRANYQSGDLLLRLGQTPEAEIQIQKALKSLESFDSPEEELARAKARYGTVLRRMGKFELAESYLVGAITTAPDLFTKARASSEASLLELSRGRPLEALELLLFAEKVFRESSDRKEEALYRHLRTLHRIAVAYWVRSTGLPFLQPYFGGSNAPHALELLSSLFAKLEKEQYPGDRYLSLQTDVALKLALLLEPSEAQAMLEKFLTHKDLYYRALSRLGYAETLTRQYKWAEALVQVLQVESVPDFGVQTWKIGLEALALLELGQEEAAWNKLEATQTLPTPFRMQLGRVLGRIWPTDRLEGRLGERGPFKVDDALAFHLGRL